MNTKMQDLSLEDLNAFIDEAVDKRLEERFDDPDMGLEVKPEIIEYIRKSCKNETTVSADEVANRLGLKW
jgi:hypothetical protein